MKRYNVGSRTQEGILCRFLDDQACYGVYQLYTVKDEIKRTTGSKHAAAEVQVADDEGMDKRSWASAPRVIRREERCVYKADKTPSSETLSYEQRTL